jgi:hypothetical protein
MSRSLHVFGAQCVGFGSNYTSSFDNAPDPATSNNALSGTNDRVRMEAWIMAGRRKISVTLDSGLSPSATASAAPQGCSCCGSVGCGCCASTWTPSMSIGFLHSLKVHKM